MTLGEFGAAKLFLFLHRCLVILDLSATGLYVGYISHSYSAAISHIPCVCVSLSHMQSILFQNLPNDMHYRQPSLLRQIYFSRRPGQIQTSGTAHT